MNGLKLIETDNEMLKKWSCDITPFTMRILTMRILTHRESLTMQGNISALHHLNRQNGIEKYESSFVEYITQYNYYELFYYF